MAIHPPGSLASVEEAFRIPDFSFVHAADLHLDTPFKGIGSTAPFVAEQLREASLAAFDSLVELCLERRAAFLVVAGDVYDGPERGLRAQLRFRDGLARLSDAGISSFVVHGNHATRIALNQFVQVLREPRVVRVQLGRVESGRLHWSNF